MSYPSLPLIATGLLLSAIGQAAQLVSTPRATLVTTSETNRPFMAAASALAPVDLAALGYAEDELLLKGQASVYDWAPAGARDAVAGLTPRVPYVTRLVVRRPVDAKRFSGRVIVEVLDTPQNYDVAPLWGLSSEYFLRSGDVWVGITVSPQAAAILGKFDPLRYESLTLGNPQADCTAAAATTTAADSGLAWDVIAQSGALLRSTSRENPLRNYSPTRVILAGYGQGASYIATFINALHAYLRLGDGTPIFDGYLSAAATAATPIHPCGTAANQALRPQARAPEVVVLTQTDLHAAAAQPRADSDEPGAVYHQYEIAGAAHAGAYPAGQPAAVDLQIAGIAIAADDICREPRSDFPTGLAFNAIWRQFDVLLVSGVALPGVPRIETDARGQPVLDRQGNAQGGWRLPQVDVPLASYSGRSTPAQDDAQSRAVCESTGSMRRYDAARLKSLYKDRNEYIKRFNAAVDQAVADGRLLKEDAPALKAPLVRTLAAF
ncbi:MAG: alpha/beta hydrolase domain-containing protein [Pseudomonadota bacterium]